MATHLHSALQPIELEHCFSILDIPDCAPGQPWVRVGLVPFAQTFLPLEPTESMLAEEGGR